MEITGVRAVDESAVVLVVEFEYAGTTLTTEVELTVEELRDPVKVGIKVLETIDRMKTWLLTSLAQKYVGYVIEEVSESASL